MTSLVEGAQASMLLMTQGKISPDLETLLVLIQPHTRQEGTLIKTSLRSVIAAIVVCLGDLNLDQEQ